MILCTKIRFRTLRIFWDSEKKLKSIEMVKVDNISKTKNHKIYFSFVSERWASIWTKKKWKRSAFHKLGKIRKIYSRINKYIFIYIYKYIFIRWSNESYLRHTRNNYIIIAIIYITRYIITPLWRHYVYKAYAWVRC